MVSYLKKRIAFMAKRGRCRGPPASMHVDASGEGGVCADPSRVLEYACWFPGPNLRTTYLICSYKCANAHPCAHVENIFMLIHIFFGSTLLVVGLTYIVRNSMTPQTFLGQQNTEPNLRPLLTSPNRDFDSIVHFFYVIFICICVYSNV